MRSWWGPIETNGMYHGCMSVKSWLLWLLAMQKTWHVITIWGNLCVLNTVDKGKARLRHRRNKDMHRISLAQLPTMKSSLNTCVNLAHLVPAICIDFTDLRELYWSFFGCFFFQLVKTIPDKSLKSSIKCPCQLPMCLSAPKKRAMASLTFTLLVWHTAQNRYTG